MEDQAVFSVASKCFGDVEEDEWIELTRRSVWSDFINGVRRLLQEARPLGEAEVPSQTLRRYCPLQEFLAVGEVDALFCPPTYAEKRQFAARHFTGGLPDSAMPVESLYESRTARSAQIGRDMRSGVSSLGRKGFAGAAGAADVAGATGMAGAADVAQGDGLYLGDAAGHMRTLITCLGLEVPPQYTAYPDHLSLELDLLAVLLRSGRVHDAHVFLRDHFGWLTSYRLRLLKLGDEASFYIGLVDVLLGIREQQTVGEEKNVSWVWGAASAVPAATTVTNVTNVTNATDNVQRIY